MRTVELQVIETLGEMAGLPAGTRIVTNHNKFLRLEEWIRGRLYWVEPGKATTPYSPLVSWLPIIVLPPIEVSSEEAVERVQRILGGEVVE